MECSATPKPRRAFTESRGLVILLGALTALDPLTIDMYLPAFGEIQQNFQTHIANVELSVSAFFVGMALGQLFYGPLADRFGRRAPLLAGMLVYLFATLGCAHAPSIEAFIGLRFLQALGGCAGMVITRAVVRDLFDKKRVAEFLSSMALVMGVAPIIAPTVGSFITTHFGWRAIFYVLAGANFLCLLAIASLLPETNLRRHSSLKIGAVLEGYGELLRDRNFVGYLIPDTAIRAGMFAYIAGSPFVFIELFKIPAERYGLIFGLNGIGLILASQINRRVLRKWAPETILRGSIGVAAAAAVLVFAFTYFGFPPFVILGALFAFLATLNFVSPNALAGALSTQGHRAGTASALYGCLQWSMASVASSLVSHFHNGTALPMTGVIMICGLISFAAFQLLVKNQAAITAAPEPTPNQAEPGP